MSHAEARRTQGRIRSDRMVKDGERRMKDGRETGNSHGLNGGKRIKTDFRGTAGTGGVREEALAKSAKGAKERFFGKRF